jgi:hypothetical protein
MREAENGGPMKYRAILIDPGNPNPERAIQLLTNSMDDVNTWAHGAQSGGMERPRGVLEKAKSPGAVVNVYAIEEKQIAVLTKKGKPE